MSRQDDPFKSVSWLDFLIVACYQAGSAAVGVALALSTLERLLLVSLWWWGSAVLLALLAVAMAVCWVVVPTKRPSIGSAAVTAGAGWGAVVGFSILGYHDWAISTLDGAQMAALSVAALVFGTCVYLGRRARSREN